MGKNDIYKEREKRYPECENTNRLTAGRQHGRFLSCMEGTEKMNNGSTIIMDYGGKYG